MTKKKDIIKALHIASKQIEIETNGGKQFVRQTVVYKNKKKYDRKQKKYFDVDY